jgi:hypothetical protein
MVGQAVDDFRGGKTPALETPPEIFGRGDDPVHQSRLSKTAVKFS